MRKHGFIVLLLVAFLVSMPVVAADLVSSNPEYPIIKNLGAFEITTINSQEEVRDRGMISETMAVRGFPPLRMGMDPARQAGCLGIGDEKNELSSALIEVEDPKRYKYNLRKRRFDHPAFIGVA